MERIIEEPLKSINGVPLTVGQAMTLRVALETFAMSLRDGCGEDEHGRAMTASYYARVAELRQIIYRPEEPAMESEPCVWTENDSGWWETTCQNSFVLDNGTPKDHGMNFCPYCGRELKEQACVREE